MNEGLKLAQKKIDKYTLAINEAKRFIKKAELAAEKLAENNYAYINGSPETAAAKRSSMDLTRALANLRK